MFANHPEPERLKAQLWTFGAIPAALGAALLTALLLWPVAQLIAPWTRGGRRPGLLDEAWWQHPGHHLATWWRDDVVAYLLPGSPMSLFGNAGVWWPVLSDRFYTLPVGAGDLPWAILVLMMAATLAVALWLRACPYDWTYVSQGRARRATTMDLLADDLFCPTGIVLGIWVTGWWIFRSYREIRNWETTSALLIAPPGTGKTVQLIHNIIADWPDAVGRKKMPVPGPSLVINDPKGEMRAKTGGWRSSLGPVITLAWAEGTGADKWNPIGFKTLPGGERARGIRLEILDCLQQVYGDDHAAEALNGILTLLRDRQDWQEALLEDPGRALPEDAQEAIVRARGSGQALTRVFEPIIDLAAIQAKREQFIDRQWAILVPETVEQHWRITGRSAGAGMTGFCIARCERDPERFGEPSYGKLLQWLNGGATHGGGFADLSQSPRTVAEDGSVIPGQAGAPANVGSPDRPTGGSADEDLTAALLDEWIEEAILYGYPARVVSDLQELRMKPDKERGSVVSTAGGSINIFKNAAVRSATSTSTFSLEDLRGVWDEAAKIYRPMTVYLVVPLEDAESMGRITGLFLDWSAAGLISQDESFFKKTGRRPVGYLIDEFWTLPPLQALRQIPALGRGQWVWLYLVGQSFGQIGSKYKSDGQNAVSELKGSTNYKVIPTQNDFQTAKEMSDSIGARTVLNTNSSRTVGFGKSVDPFARNEQQSLGSQPLYRPEDITSMEKLDPQKGKPGKQLVQIAGALNRPIECRPPVYFWAPAIARKAGLPRRNKRLQRRIGMPMTDWSHLLMTRSK